MTITWLLNYYINWCPVDTYVGHCSGLFSIDCITLCLITQQREGSLLTVVSRSTGLLHLWTHREVCRVYRNSGFTQAHTTPWLLTLTYYCKKLLCNSQIGLTLGPPAPNPRLAGRLRGVLVKRGADEGSLRISAVRCVLGLLWLHRSRHIPSSPAGLGSTPPPRRNPLPLLPPRLLQAPRSHSSGRGMSG